MFISVEFGDQQRRLFNIECKTAPLLDAINDGCYADMLSLLKTKKDYFTSELNQMKKKEESLQKKLNIDEDKQEDVSPHLKSSSPPKGKGNKDLKGGAARGGNKQVKVRTVNENPIKDGKTPGKKAKDSKKAKEIEEAKHKEEEELKAKQKEEEEKKKAEEEEKKKAEAEAAAKKAKKPPGKGQPAPEEEEEKKELTEEEKKEKERQQIAKNLEEVKATIEKLQHKLDLIDKTFNEMTEEAKVEKVLDLQDRSADRKFMKTKAEQYANTYLTEKMPYTLGKLVKKENDEEEFVLVKIDRAWIRTLEEDAAFAEEQALANEPKKGKK